MDVKGEVEDGVVVDVEDGVVVDAEGKEEEEGITLMIKTE